MERAFYSSELLHPRLVPAHAWSIGTAREEPAGVVMAALPFFTSRTIRVTFAHILLARTSHVVLPNLGNGDSGGGTGGRSDEYHCATNNAEDTCW